MKYGKGEENENVLAVKVYAMRCTCWWYEGGGVYRHVTLVAAPRVHVEKDGLFAPSRVTGQIQAKGSAPKDGHTATSATIDARVTLVNDGSSGAQVAVCFDVFDAANAKIASQTTKGAAEIQGNGALTLSSGGISLASVELWSVPRPYLYSVRATVLVDGQEGDSYATTVGVYSTEWTSDRGFFMNDKHIKIRGFCDHNDFGGVGMAVHERIKLFRAQALRSVGGNGRRMSHNPPDPSTLHIYDRLGVVSWMRTGCSVSIPNT